MKNAREMRAITNQALANEKAERITRAKEYVENQIIPHAIDLAERGYSFVKVALTDDALFNDSIRTVLQDLYYKTENCNGNILKIRW